jgi:DNA-binding NtrC family response regulator
MPGTRTHTGVRVKSAPDPPDSIKRKPPELETGVEFVDVLSVTPTQSDHDSLERFLGRSKWRVHRASTLATGVELLRQKGVSLVICERDLCPGSWRDFLAHITLLPKPPHLIVTSRLADEQLWAEALNLGAYDVLSKPLESNEVARVLGSAWLHWNRRFGVASEPPKATASRMA